MDDKLKIHLLIDNQKYPLTIPREDQVLYREAARQIDNKLNKYRRLFPEQGSGAHWAMTCLELAFENTGLRAKNDTEPYMEVLKRLEDCIDDCILDQKEE